MVIHSVKELTLLMVLERFNSLKGENTSIYYHMILIFAIFNATANLSVVLNLMFEIVCFSPHFVEYVNIMS